MNIISIMNAYYYQTRGFKGAQIVRQPPSVGVVEWECVRPTLLRNKAQKHVTVSTRL